MSRYDPDGRRERVLRVPATQSSSVTFGGPELDEIYVTSASLHNCLMLAPSGYNPASVFPGGPLFRSRLEMRGQLKRRSDIQPPHGKIIQTPSSKAL